MIMPCTGERTIKISVSYRIIEKDYQELKIFIEDKIFQKYLKRKKQLLIENAFKRTYNRTNLSQVQGIDLCKKV